MFLSHSVCSSPIAFAPLSGTSAHGESPLTIPLMTFMTTQEQKQSGDKMDTGLILMQDLPQLGLDLNSGISHTISVHVFLKTQVPNAHLRPSEWSMNIIKSNTPRGVHQKLFFRLQPKLSPKPIYGIYCCEKSYQRTGSEWHLYASFVIKGLTFLKRKTVHELGKL